MQKVIRSYIFDGKSFEELQKALQKVYLYNGKIILYVFINQVKRL